MDFDSLEYKLCSTIWKHDGWPQIYIPFPTPHVSPSDILFIGNTKPNITLPYSITGDQLIINNNRFLISFVRNNKLVPYIKEMELLDSKGAAYFFKQIQYGEPQIAAKQLIIPIQLQDNNNGND